MTEVGEEPVLVYISGHQGNMEDLFEVTETDLNTSDTTGASNNDTSRARTKKSSSKHRHVHDHHECSGRQEPYSNRDRQLLASLMAEIDTSQILFSTKRDIDTCKAKQE
jgi:hypothetical protein